MSDLGLVRYLGYAAVRSLPALRARLEREQAAQLADGIHLIAVQGAGRLAGGGRQPSLRATARSVPAARGRRPHPRASFAPCSAIRAPEVIERWVGVYPSGPDVGVQRTPMPGVRLVMVTSGTGASTAFALAEETIADLLHAAPPPHAA